MHLWRFQSGLGIGKFDAHHHDYDDLQRPSTTSDDLRRRSTTSETDNGLITSTTSETLGETDDGLITCDRSTQVTKQMTVPDFYKKSNRCSHIMKDAVTFLHVGKSGGGTVTRELRNNRIRISMNHPRPVSGHIRNLQKGPSRTLIINVRDPIERFVSAFRWRLVVLCKPNDERQAGKKGAAHHPLDKCKNTNREEEQMLRETYQSDPNVLAEALCEDSPLYKDAIQDYSKILHSMTLSEWLEFLIDPSMNAEITDDGIQNFHAIPLEKQDNGETLFEQHIENISLHLLQTRYTLQKAKDLIKQKPHEVSSTGKEIWSHSSAKFQNSTNAEAVPPVLSPLGECCLARHLEQDYRLIQTMIMGDGTKQGTSNVVVEPLAEAHPVIRKACLWGSKEQQKLCQSDLKSMLLRRAQHLDRSQGNCSQR